jgi:uncharacterized protein YabN with tetrapyrrole methylase and pyrophosphatase domain
MEQAGPARSRIPPKLPCHFQMRALHSHVGDLTRNLFVSRRFDDLVALQQTLLSPQGCPWDREQTHDTLRTYLLEETYEVLDAIDSGDSAKFAEELGDLLLQIVFHANLAQIAGRFDISDVIESIYTKMVRRHPHVFASDTAETPAAVLKNWEHLKAEERRQKLASSFASVGARHVVPQSAGSPPAPPTSALNAVSSRGAAGAEGSAFHQPPSAPASSAPFDAPSLLDGVPKNLPAILQAFQITRRAARIGFDWERIEGVLDKVAEEAGELRATLGDPGRARKEEEVGDLLFAVVNVARFLDLDPELALRKANQKFEKRFHEMEREAARTGQPLAASTPQQFELLWEQAKDKS